ncbi:MAG: cation-translocating P-type ATPase, partial [Oscillospiraceae bacterium]|nr:cation-translocating P-type ATPase [Candidatus Equicaccousia limihippi]
TPLKAQLATLGKMLGIGVLAICAVVFIIGLFQFKPDPNVSAPVLNHVVNIFMTAIALAVAAIPEGLPAIVTVVLALGVNRMVKRNAIIRNLPAVETLGSASVICSDKTGTLTQNKMTVNAIFDGEAVKTENFNENDQMLFRLAAMCSNGNITNENGTVQQIGDPTEIGLVAAAEKYCYQTKTDIDAIYPRLCEIPFDSERKLMTTVNMINGKPFAVVKGAPDILTARCSGGYTEKATQAIQKMAQSGLRVIAVAVKPLDAIPANPTPAELENGLTFVGLIGMIDPPRPEARDAVSLCHKAGIRTVMITGDHVITAKSIAEDLGILRKDEYALTGEDLSKLSEEEFEEIIEKVSVYARVTPEDKIRIVRAWQKKGHIVAMTGDGVNDAPALKAADIGCAMGQNGTDVAKGASDMTLADDNFATIVSAVREGRSIFDNIKKTVHFLVSCNFGEVLTVFFGMLFTGASPLSAIQLLWLNLVTDSAPALALGLENAEYDIMERAPRRKNSNIFNSTMLFNVLWQGLAFMLLTLIAYAIGGAVCGATMAFLTLSLSQLLHAFSVRSEHSLFKAGFFSNLYMLAAFCFSLALILVVMLTPLNTVFGFAPLTFGQWLICIGLSFIMFVLGEFSKWLTKYLRSKNIFLAHIISGGLRKLFGKKKSAKKPTAEKRTAAKQTELPPKQESETQNEVTDTPAENTQEQNTQDQEKQDNTVQDAAEDNTQNGITFAAEPQDTQPQDDSELDIMFREFLYGDRDDSRKDSVTLQTGISKDEMQSDEKTSTEQTHKQDDLFAVLKYQPEIDGEGEQKNGINIFEGVEDYGYNAAQNEQDTAENGNADQSTEQTADE